MKIKLKTDNHAGFMARSQGNLKASGDRDALIILFERGLQILKDARLMDEVDEVLQSKK